jgi:hypothetical protein
MLFLLLACTSEKTTSYTYYQDIQPILEARCVNCHVDGAIGGFALDDTSTIQELSPAIANAVESRTMPPWSADSEPSFINDWSLSDEQINVIVEWADNDAELGDPADIGAELPSIGTKLSRVDTSIQIPDVYTSPLTQGDDYRCFIIDWDGTETTYITGFNAKPQNNEMVHHVAAFLVRPDGLLGESIFETMTEWDEADPDLGYSCFGGPSATGASSQVPIEQLAQWVPGSQGLDFPEGTGIKIDPDSKIILQIHYYIPPNLSNKSDQTSLEFSLSSEVESPAAYAPFLNGLWPISGMEIPAGQDNVEHSTQGDPRPFFNLLNPNLDLDQGFTIHSMMMHMHRLGKSGTLSLIKADGTEQTLVNIPTWDFDWQFTYILEDSVAFQDGDELRLRCIFDNSASDAVDVSWGEGTEDEMCVGNLYISTP